ncbi:MAG: alpha/beta hydrolase [Clostridia bacterium]|nr:alpha/beta hydrolase [Clostridia bacterium]
MTFLKNWPRTAKVITVLAVLLLLTCSVCAAYLGDYYRADMAAIESFCADRNVPPVTAENGSIVLAPDTADTGLIFYPGGKVEHTAYIPLMQALAEENTLCVLVEMPFRLAVFDINAADGIQAQYPQIENWYIGGHPLGGSMAASYLSEHTDTFDGLLLLGSYSTADLSGTGLSVLSIYGSEDKVLNQQKYEENRNNLPKGFREVILEGGCHAQFGMYGPQTGDGTPTLSSEEQIGMTADAITAWISDKSP